MVNKETVQEVEVETKRFLKKLERFKEAVKDKLEWKQYGTPPWPFQESAEMKRASLDLSKALSRMRRPHVWNEEKQKWE